MKKFTVLIIYLVALLVIATFIPFGLDNIMIPIASLLLVPTLITDDYKSDMFKNMLKIFATFLGLSLSASVLGLNLYIGVLITFAVAFIIYYFYTYDNKKSKATSYMLYYVLVLSVPINKHEIILRLSACIYGAIIIVALYYTLSKTGFLKSEDAIVDTAYDNLSRAILLKIQGDTNYYAYILKALEQSLCADSMLVKKIYGVSRNSDVFIKKELTLDIMKSLGSIVNKTEDTNILRDISRLLKWLMQLYKEEITIHDLELNLSSQIYLSSGYENSLIKKHISNFLSLYKNEVLTTNEKQRKRYVRKVIKKYDSMFNLGFSFNIAMDSVRFNTAIKGSILIAVITFVIYFLNLRDGQWVLYSVAATYLPFTGAGIKKVRAKIFATILGFIAINLILKFVDSKFIILILILACGYLSIYFISYGNKIIFMMFSTIGAEFMFTSMPHNSFILDKLIYIIIGGGLSYVVTKYIFPLKTKNQLRSIYKAYIKLNEEILKNVQEKSLEELFNEMQNGAKEQVQMTTTEILIVYRILLVKSRFLSSSIKSKYSQRFNIKEALIISDYKNITRMEDENTLIQETMLPTYDKSSLILAIHELKKPLNKKLKKTKSSVN
ncbi:MAG: FUSC family protein [Sarcina sp.]